MDVVRRTDIVDQLGRVSAPTLVSVGELDPVTPVAAEEIGEALPEGIAQLEIIEGGGHFTWMDAPDRFWPILSSSSTRPLANAPRPKPDSREGF